MSYSSIIRQGLRVFFRNVNWVSIDTQLRPILARHTSIYVQDQARSQTEARKPGLQYHMDLDDARNLTLLLANNKGAGQPAHLRSLRIRAA